MKDLSLSARLAMADNNPDNQEAKLRNVRRRLDFGDSSDDNNSPTKEELERRFAEEQAKHLEEKKAKWNFDFNAGRPLPGPWEWEPAERGASSSAPASSGADAAADRSGVQ